MQKNSYLGGAAVKTGPLAVSALPPKQQSMKTLFKKKKKTTNSEQEKVKWFSDFFCLPIQSQRSLLEPWVNIAWV